jgi:hypothetical protein
LYEKNGLYPRKCLVDSGTWRKAGGDLGDFVDQAISVFILVGLRFIHKTILMLSLELIMVWDYKMVHKG